MSMPWRRKAAPNCWPLCPGGTGAGDEVSKRIELWESEVEASFQRCRSF